MAGRHAFITLLGCAALAWPRGARAQQEVQSIADRVIRRLDLQTEFPRVAEPLRLNIDLPAEVLWVVIAVAVCVLLYALRDVLPNFRWGHDAAWQEDEADHGKTGSLAPAAALGTADDLARNGRFVEAMHALLLQGLADIRLRLDEQFADSLTSREILHSTRLSAEGRSSLRDMITRVEWTYFGLRPATRSDYDACRASFNALEQGLRGMSA